MAIIAVYFFGASFAIAYEFNPIAGGLTGVFLAGLSKSPQGSLRSGIDLSEVVSQLGTYLNVPKNANGFWRRIYNELELLVYARKKSGQVGRHIGMQSSNTQVLQAFQKLFTPKGDVAFTPYISQVFRLKVDFLLDNIDEIYDSYLHFLADETIDRKDWPLVKYIVEYHLIPSIVDELNIASCVGYFVPPTPNVAGASINSMDGLLTIVAKEVANGAITPIITGAIAANNAVSKVETFADGIDVNYTKQGGVIFCSHDVARKYKGDYRTLFGATNDQKAKNNTFLDNYKIELVPLLGFGASQRLVFTPTGSKGNLLWLYDKILNPTKFEVQKQYRDIILMTDFNAGVGFETTDTVFTNDQVSSAPVITSPLVSGGTASSPFSYTIQAANAPTAFAATGLPAGLTVNTTTGVISGTPSGAGTSNVSISATNSMGTTTATLVITIS